MRVQWTTTAAEDLEKISDYLYEQNPAHAGQLVQRIYESASVLRQFPNRARLGRKQGTRELVLTSLPYIIIYKIAEERVLVLRVLHGAQRWP